MRPRDVYYHYHNGNKCERLRTVQAVSQEAFACAPAGYAFPVLDNVISYFGKFSYKDQLCVVLTWSEPVCEREDI
ncbi:hypothetical protein BGX33_007977 [Mortierella sp. NVP41]|nr:hypothetical protein BGX33_007977 [Mortierella sp. NVP41]